MVVLASASPRRIEILRAHGTEAAAVPAGVEEYASDGVPPRVLCMYNALKKALYVSPRYTDDIVIGADTAVVSRGRILGKPLGEEDAFNMLSELRGGTHSVYTGVAVVRASGVKPVKRVFYECTSVTFGFYSDSDIIAYIKSGEPMDKAGSYGIQGSWASNVTRVEGDTENVIGLPWNRLVKELEEAGLSL